MKSASSTALLVVGTLVAWGGYFGYRHIERKPDVSPVAAEDVAAKARSVRAAFTDAGSVSDAEVEALVNEIQAASSRSDEEALVKLISARRMTDAIVEEAGVDLPAFGRTILANQLVGEASTFFDPTVVETTLKKIDRDSRGNLVVYLRQVDQDRITTKARWWLFDDGDGLRWWDSEDLEMGFRATTLMSAAISTAQAQGETAKLEHFVEVLAQFGELDFTDDHALRAAAEQLKTVDATSFPPSLSRLLLMLRASAAVGLDEPEGALALLDELDALSPERMDLPLRHFQRATAMLDLQRYDESIVAIGTYLDILGDDADALTLLGGAEVARGNHAVALAAFDRGIADDVEQAGNYAGAATATTDVPALSQRLRKAPNDTVLDYAADELLAAGDHAALARFIEAAAQAKPQWDGAVFSVELPPEGD